MTTTGLSTADRAADPAIDRTTGVDGHEPQPDVLVVGAGPVGTALAADLLRQGLRVRLIDRAERVEREDSHSRAILLVPRALELLRRIGATDRLIAEGHPVPGIGYYSEGRLLGTARLDRLDDTPYPFVLSLPQRVTEQVLAERLDELGGNVERGVALEAVHAASPDSAVATLRHADGSSETVTSRFVVGADGANSTARHLLGQRLTGDSTDVTYLIADAPLTGDLPSDAQYYYSRNGILAVIPMRDGQYRMAVNIPHLADGDPPPDARAVLQDAVDQRARRPFQVGTPTYARPVRPRCGSAQAYRVGPVLLVGDAAHVITPAGGQGMNLGLHDAASLSWRLGGILRGDLAAGTLDDWAVERRDAARRTAATTAQVIGLALRRTRIGSLARDAVFVGAERAGLVHRLLARRLTQLDVDHGPDSFVPAQLGRRRPVPDESLLRIVAGSLLRRDDRPAPGQRLPAHTPVPGALVQPGAVLDPDRMTVVLSPGRRVPPDWTSTGARVRAALPPGSAVIDLAARPDRNAAALRAALGPRPSVAAVRPDGHLGVHVPVTGLADLTAYLSSLRPAGAAGRTP
jgi:2-polyprenyl-6-methoxyphenol hydroxylase-like FAD-dependent oxidoreductase